MPNATHQPGLLGQGMSNSHGKHLYHASKPAVIAYVLSDEEKYKADGYTEDYVTQEYPKYDAAKGVTYMNAAHEASFQAPVDESEA